MITHFRDAGPEYGIVNGRTIPQLLRQHAASSDRAILVIENENGSVESLTTRDLLKRTIATAEHLRARNVGRGDRVHLQLPNGLDFLLLWFALAEIGAVMVPTNTLSSSEETSYVLAHSRASLSITDADGADRVAAAASTLPAPPEVARSADLITDGPVTGPVPAPEATAEGDAAILYTSGTTARPKGVVITHANYVFAGEVYAAAMRLSEQDTVLVALPLFHANAQYYSVMGALVSGAKIVVVPRFSASAWIRQVRRHAVTVANLFAAPIRMILAWGASVPPGILSLRAVMFAQNLTESEIALWKERVGAPLVQGYGMTETVGIPIMNPLVGGSHHAIGRPTLPYRCRVSDGAGNTLGPGEPGELLISGIPGVSLMSRYLDDPKGTAAILRDGWLHTGDLVRIGPDGLFRFVDRAKDMIKTSGENVAASEVEAVLLAHPAVRDAAVIGIPDPVRTECVAAVVVAAEPTTEQVLLAWCAERLARFRVPVSIRFTGELPRTSVGKVRKNVIKQRWLAEEEGEPVDVGQV